MRVSGYQTMPNFSPPTLKLLQIFGGTLFGHTAFLLTPYKNS